MSNEKKLTTREIVQQQLERKKQAQANNNKNTQNGKGSAKQMQSQLSKKPSMTRRKMGD